MSDNRPSNRKKYTTSGSSSVDKRGEGLGTGPVGSGNGHNNSTGGFDHGSGSGKTITRGAAGGSGIMIILLVAYLIFGGGGGTSSNNSPVHSGNQSNGSSTNMNSVNSSVADGSRAKYTNIKGDKDDVVTLMVYMCGTDLESRSGMATNDLTEMANATNAKNVNIIVYTGGCARWKNNIISNSTNQIYQVKDGGLKCLVSDDGNKGMTKPETLTDFIKYCKENFPANRNCLILWDHGGGSVSGYGYDEKQSKNGSMTLGGIKKALENAQTKFDFIGFDACLMATCETALMLDPYADYLIASEETEPGIGWYYTNWLTKLSKDTSMPTLEIGKNIIDDFTAKCASQCRGQKTTLSIIDLAEFSNTIPSRLSEFSKSISSLIEKKEYKAVSDARYETREFAANTRIDQVDLVDLANNMKTDEGKALASAIISSVKYNQTSSSMTNAYGVSIYFPYRKTSYVNKAVDTYDNIGMDDEYSKCIKEFASLETSGQISTGGSQNPLGSLLGGGDGGSSSMSSDMIGSLLQTFLSGDSQISINGLTDVANSFLSGRALPTEDMAEYISENYFDSTALKFETNDNGESIIKLSENQWDLVHSIDKNTYVDDGSGYIDLGLDNVYEFDENKNLIADTDRDWLAINNQIVPYYHIDTTETDDETVTTGYVPCKINDVKSKLIIVFDKENPKGYIAGAQTDYDEDETLTIAKSMSSLNVGDKLDFICDYYSYDGKYNDSYLLGEQMTVTDNMTISNIAIADKKVKITYLFTDIYNQQYWTDSIDK
ncbi:clostripain-related cysteine peptidase [Eubacterium sp.]|uniref:clostripain-related cysteine peptidase n=1 Tax=Eubacterium sp. TaxID=142586 RepID=UPI0025F98858|nr:clostripain-related cysteine peptidase [Eubacterium sp.]MCR5630314.1 peptidase C11 [Eubacterium sp.]